LKSINPITKKVIIAIIITSATVHLLTLIIGQSVLVNWRLEQVPFHSAIEISGSVIAFFVAYMLVLLERNNRGTSYNYVIAGALIAMGVLDGFHSIVPKGQLFVWLHSSATFLGGIIFLCIYFPKSWRDKFSSRWLLFVLLCSFSFAIISSVYSNKLPIMADQSGFTSIAVFLNVIGGCMLLTSAIKLLITYRQTKKTDDLLFVLHCTMFGFAAIMFQQSVLWDVSWWGWHILRFLAYGVALWFALANEVLVNLQIKDSRDALNEEVEIKSAQLTQASHLLKMNQAQQNAIFRCLTDAIIVCDKAGNIIFFFQPAQKMFGYSEAEVEHKNINQLLEFPSNEAQKPLRKISVIDDVFLGETQELIAIHKTEKELSVEMLINEVEFNNQANTVAVIRDISVRKKYESELKRAKEQADTANQAKSLFLANTSHEIRTPMNGVYGNLQLLEKERLTITGQGYLERAIYSTRRLMAIIDDILDISKIEAGKLAIEEVEFSLSKLVESITSDIIHAAKRKYISFKPMLNVEHDIWLGDPNRIRQILLNITSNAVKFTDSGSVVLSITYIESTKELVFIVTDTGIGMNEYALEKLFNPFEQADDSTTRKYGGTGIGMSITYALVSLMNGKINVASEEDNGTTFTVRLPVLKGIKALPLKNETKINQLELNNKTILLAEDNRINQTIVKAMLGDTGVTMKIVANGIEAIDMAKALTPDLILMDIEMPKIDGIKACKVIKKIMPNVPIIALTANVMSDDIEKYLDAGFNGIVGKPIELDVLLKAIDSSIT
jgi:PAS domain S-box-containing protein